MNKSDFKLVALIIAIVLVFFLLNQKNTSSDKQAIVYYKDDVSVKIDLTIQEEKKYTVKGENGDVILIAKEGKVKVKEEKSPLHLCSKQGYIANEGESIVCLPNKVVIAIESKEKIDAVVK